MPPEFIMKSFLPIQLNCLDEWSVTTSFVLIDSKDKCCVLIAKQLLNSKNSTPGKAENYPHS